MDEKYVRCLMVETGYESLVSQLLRVRELGRGMYPQRIRVRKLRGVWKKDRIRLLPGYVFVFSDEKIPIWFYQGTEHVLKVLRYDREPDGYLRGADLEFARMMEELDGKLDILDAVKEEDFIRITDEILNRLHGEVLSVDRGKRLVKIRVHLLGQTRILKLNYQLLDDEGKPMAPADQWLEDQSDEWLTAWTPDFTEDLANQMDGGAVRSLEPEGYWEDLDRAAEESREETDRENAAGQAENGEEPGNGPEQAQGAVAATDEGEENTP